MLNFSKNDQKYMARALKLAALAQGKTSPNPMVGAVIVKNGKIIGEGYHQKYGEAHAEVNALAAAGAEAEGAELFVNLEPCSHFGKTPPCTQKIINSGLKRVVVSMVDPNPKVAGRGLKLLKKVGIKVEVGLLKAEAETLNEIFLEYIQTDYPFVYLKQAQTLDGYIATSTGDSKWITNKLARKKGHELRHQTAGIMVGIKTVLADNPSLTARLDSIEAKDSLRIILDPFLEIPIDSKIINQKSEAETLIITAAEFPPAAAAKTIKKREEILKKEKVKLISFALDNNNFFDLKEILKYLHKQKIASILVEGGAKLSHSFLAQKLIDKFYYFIAPKIYGGNDGCASFSGSGPKLMADAVNLEIIEQRNLADNILLIAVSKNEI